MIECVDVPKADLDLSKSHVRVEPSRDGGYVCLGAIAHRDVIDMAPIGSKVPVHRTKAIETAMELAARFKLPKIYLVRE